MGSDVASLRFSVEILRRLGEELNPNADQGIIELVKNAYDADARTCTVTLDAVDKPGGTITVVDDGNGMTAETIRDAWLILGRSSKSADERTRLGRIPAGSKGLGRLAALRLGDFVELRSWPREDLAYVYYLQIDWRLFDRAKVIEDVAIQIHRAPRPPAEVKKQGTRVTLRRLHAGIGRSEARRLARALILLGDPFGDDAQGFRPALESQDFADLSKLVKDKFFDTAKFRVRAQVDAEGRASAEFCYATAEGVKVERADHAELTEKSDHKPYGCPPADFDFYNFIWREDKGALGGASVGLRKSMKEWIRAFGGVHIYENGLRVHPYGDEGDDWLGINLRRAQRSEERPSTNNSIGRIAVTNTQGVLVQKTDRTGYVQNPAFLELRRFAEEVLEWMGKRRLALAEAARSRKKAAAAREVRTSRQQLALEIDKLDGEHRTSAKAALDAYEKSREREAEALRKELQLYRTLATAGIMSAVFYHEARAGAQKTIQGSIGSIERRARKELGERYRDVLARDVGLVKDAVASLVAVGDLTFGLLAHEKRRKALSDVNAVVTSLLDRFEPYLAERKIGLERRLCPGHPVVRASQAALESVLANLLSNSVTALEAAECEAPRIEVSTVVEASVVTLRVTDNGDGIAKIGVKDIWLPGQTTRAGGTGLGLTIVRDIVQDLRGKASALARGPLGGAEFTVQLPLEKKR